jgi:hypothetical protein
VENALNSGTYVDEAQGRVLFGDYAEQWRAVQVHRPGTEISVEQQLRLHVYPVIGHRRMKDIRTTEIQALVRRLDLSASTVEVVYGRVAAIFRAAVRSERSAPVSVGIDARWWPDIGWRCGAQQWRTSAWRRGWPGWVS